jgi:hypothetical protein
MNSSISLHDKFTYSRWSVAIEITTCFQHSVPYIHTHVHMNVSALLLFPPTLITRKFLGKICVPNIKRGDLCTYFSLKFMFLLAVVNWIPMKCSFASLNGHKDTSLTYIEYVYKRGLQNVYCHVSLACYTTARFRLFVIVFEVFT